MPMPLVSLLPAAGPHPAPSRFPFGVSVLLHLAALALLLLLVKRPSLEESSAPSYQLVFDDGGPPATSGAPAPESQAALLPPEDAPPLPPTPSPTVPPDPDSTGVPPVEAAMAPPDPATPAPPQEVQVFPAEPPSPPAVNLGEAAPALPEFTVPEPQAEPPPRAQPQPQTQPQTQPQVRPEARSQSRTAQPAPPRPRAPSQAPANPFAAPMDLSFAPAPYRAPTAPRGSVASRSIDLSPGAPRPGVNRGEAYFEVRARNVSADWKAGLQAYWLRHRYYPRQAVEAGEDGTVVIEMVVNRLGRVESVEVKSRSGSAWLDMAAVGTWRNAQLPPLPAETAGERITVEIPIHYMLIR